MVLNKTSDIQRALETKARAVLDEVSEKVYETLIKIIRSEIYEDRQPERYRRTGDFLKAFQLKDIKKFSNKLTRELFYNWRDMTAPKRIGAGDNEYLQYIHGNAETGEDRRKDLWWILNNPSSNMIHSDFGGALNVDTIGYLEIFNVYMRNDFWKWVDAACNKQGLQRKR